MKKFIIKEAVLLSLLVIAALSGVFIDNAVLGKKREERLAASRMKATERGVFDEIALFDSHFRSPLEQFGAWNPNEEYTWSWTLGRAEKGEWALVNYGWKENWFKSEQYSFDDLIAGMEGTSFRYMKYAGDEFSSSELEYINSLDRGSFDECAVYYVWFMSPREAYGAWEPYTLYSWSFYLGRTDQGQWQVVTFGN